MRQFPLAEKRGSFRRPNNTAFVDDKLFNIDNLSFGRFGEERYLIVSMPTEHKRAMKFVA